MSSATQPLAVPREGIAGLARDYSVLIKARVTTLIVMTAWAGAYFAAAKSGVPSLSWTLLHALIGIGLVSGGTAAINEVVERDVDALMRRTAQRPLVTGSMSLLHASIIAFRDDHRRRDVSRDRHQLANGNPDCLTSFSYLVVYTPMKRVHPICTFLGAFPGAMPPVLGWTAIRGRLDPEALVLFAILFFWQFPHFHSIAWLYREDYENARIRMLPVVESDGRSTAFAIVMYAPGADAGLARACADRHGGMDLLRRRAAARHRHVLVQPAHVDDEAHAQRTAIEAARTSRPASLGDLPSAAVRADDAQSRVRA